MKYPLCITIFVAGLTYSEKAFSQFDFNVDDSLRVINFRVIDSNSKEPVGLAHVVNMNKHVGVISDMLGYFAVPFAVGDSLKITAIGYNSLEIFCWEQYKTDTLFYTITLSPKVYEIKEVKIFRFSTYDKFLSEVTNLKLPITKEEEQLIGLQKYLHRVVKGEDLKRLPQPVSGITFGKDWYVRQNEKLAKLMDKEKDRRAIDRKYNPGLVQKLTGLQSDELYKFFTFLNFDDKFILTSSDYEIREKILAKYKDFMNQKTIKETTPQNE